MANCRKCEKRGLDVEHNKSSTTQRTETKTKHEAFGRNILGCVIFYHFRGSQNVGLCQRISITLIPIGHLHKRFVRHRALPGTSAHRSNNGTVNQTTMTLRRCCCRIPFRCGSSPVRFACTGKSYLQHVRINKQLSGIPIKIQIVYTNTRRSWKSNFNGSQNDSDDDNDERLRLHDSNERGTCCVISLRYGCTTSCYPPPPQFDIHTTDPFAEHRSHRPTSTCAGSRARAAAAAAAA